MKVLIILLCVGGGFFLLCCGGFVYIGSQMKFEINEDAASAEKLASEIADIEIPETFKPTSSGDIDAIFMKMKMVAYERDEGNGLLMLMHMEISVGGAAQQRAEMRQQMNQQDMGQRNLIIKNSETREFEIRDETVEFVFSEAVDPETDTAYREVTGTFSSDAGIVLFLLQVESDAYDDDEVTKIIESIE